MRVKVEIELEVTTDYTEIVGCTEENFKEHIQFVLKDMYQADHVGDIDFVSLVNITFPNGEE